MNKIGIFNGERLKSARIFRAKTIAELAEEINVTKQAISQYENGKVAPSLETLLLIIRSLGFPREYFYEEDIGNVKIRNTYFRSLLTTNKIDRLSQVEKIKIIAKIYHFLNQYIEFPKPDLPKIDLENNDIEAISIQVRKFWELGNEPIPNMVRLLEKKGLILTSFSTGSADIDAFSQPQEVNGIKEYFIVLGNEKYSAARRQFDAAHELAHILLDEFTSDLEQVSREEFHQIEADANQFASAFLLPRDSFSRDLVYPNKLEFYVELKKKWKVSISAMIVRAFHLKILNYNQYQYLMRQISKKGWRTGEPLDNVIQVPKTTLFKKAIELLIENEILTGEKILQKLSALNLSLNRSDVETLLELEENTLQDKKQSSPIISIRKD